MPSLTFAGVSLLNYQVVTNALDEADGGVVTISNPGGAVLVVAGAGAQTRVPPGPGLSANQGVRATADITVSGLFPYDSVPAIPNDAIIESIEFGYNGTVVGSGVNASDGVGSGLQCVDISGTIVPDIGANSIGGADSSTVDNGDSENLSASDSITSGTRFTDNFGGTPITKAALEAAYPGVSFAIFEEANCGACAASAGVYGEVNANSSVSLSNFIFIINYSLPGIDFSITPANGNVESGQSIEVSSPDIDVQELEYAAVSGDSVIPLIPKKNPDGTVTLTVPSPASSDCLDALAGCPECDDCFDACAEDLENEACQACMEACIDCLTEFFENIELSEECNESTHEAPGEVVITIIASGVGLTGAVPLGTFTILETRGSGIYQFLPGKTNDTLYSSERDGTTYDVRIPNPFFKTGFFRS